MLWTAPEKNKGLQAAIKHNRILTVRQQNVGNKRDVGFVGFRPVPQASFLVFPRPLEASRDQKVIGINYSLLDQADPEDSDA